MATAKKKSPNVEVYLEKVRLSYPYLFRARVQKDDEGKETKKFQAVFIVPKKDKKQVDLVWDAVDEVIEGMWGERPAKLKDEKICFRDGDDEDGEEFHGAWKLSASNSKRPDVRDKDKSPLVEDDGKPYAGCYVNCILRIWAQDNTYGKRVNASLEVVQFYKDGEAFGAPKVDADKKLKDFSDEDDDKPARGKRRPAEDDEDEKPARSRRAASKDDDEDEKPARSRRAAAEDDEDEKPARSRRSRDEDEEDEAPRRRRSSRD